MKALKYIVLLCVLCSCSEIQKERAVVAVQSPVFKAALTSDSNLYTHNNVQFSEQGATFVNRSYLQIDTIPTLEDNFNISFWFKITETDGTISRTLFNAIDTVNTHKQLNIGLGGFRLTGNLNSNRFSAKDFSKESGSSRTYFDLPRLEVGKYYFFSMNKIKNKIEIFVNAELYQVYEPSKDTDIRIDKLLLGVLNIEGVYRNQFIGAIRNFEIYNSTLDGDQIYAVSVAHYKEIEPFNDAHELSKFNIKN